MLDNLKDFAKGYEKSTNCGNNGCNSQNNVSMEEKAKELVNKYKNMNNDELITLLLNEVTKQKLNGTFNKNQLLTMLESVKGMLQSEEQYNEIKRLIMQL